MFSFADFGREMERVSEISRAFHVHLDECGQCRNNPFNLCSKGREIIKKVGSQ